VKHDGNRLCANFGDFRRIVHKTAPVLRQVVSSLDPRRIVTKDLFLSRQQGSAISPALF